MSIRRGDSGEALAVVGCSADALQAVLCIVDGEHHFWPPQPIVVVLIPARSQSLEFEIFHRRM